MHGTNLKPQMPVHIPGVGDHELASIEMLSDPCPLPEHLAEKRRHKLNAKERIIYAPMSDIGGIVYVFFLRKWQSSPVSHAILPFPVP